MPVAPLRCPLCAGMVQVDSDWAGRQVACPLCRGEFVVPPAQPLADVSAARIEVPPAPPISLEAYTTNGTDTTDAADLLPPGAATAFEPKAVEPPANVVAPAIVITAHETPAPRRQQPPKAAIHRLTPKERAQRRLVKNAIVFGVCIVTLVVVFYLLAR